MFNCYFSVIRHYIILIILYYDLNMLFNINKTSHKDVIIRHFASRQPWRKEWFSETDTLKFQLLNTFPLNLIRQSIEPKLRKIKRFWL